MVLETWAWTVGDPWRGGRLDRKVSPVPYWGSNVVMSGMFLSGGFIFFSAEQ